ncbi:MAG TPA: hypothetical protein VHE79_01065, partial [Spirochaetia bacterium]
MSGAPPSTRTISLAPFNTALVARVVAVVAAAAGLTVLLGWLLGVSALTAPWPGWRPSSPVSALCAVVAAASVVLTTGFASNKGAARAFRAAAVAGAMFCAVLGMATLVAYVGDFELPSGIIAVGGHVRMAMLSASSFILLGCALLLLNTPRRWMHTVAQWLAIVTCGLSYFAALAAALIGPSLYRAVSIAFSAPPTALMITLVGVGTVLAGRDGGVVEALAGRGPGGTLLRRVLLYTLTISPILAALELRAELTGYIDLSVGVAMLATANILLFCVVAWVTARAIDRADAKRRDA